MPTLKSTAPQGRYVIKAPYCNWDKIRAIGEKTMKKCTKKPKIYITLRFVRMCVTRFVQFARKKAENAVFLPIQAAACRFSPYRFRGLY